MSNLTILKVMIGSAIATLTVYAGLKVLSTSPAEIGLEIKQELSDTEDTSMNQHPIIGKSKSEISRLFPGNCFAEIYLGNPSFGGKLVDSCKQKTIEQVKSLTGIKISKAELSSPEVVNHLKSIYGANNPWRL